MKKVNYKGRIIEIAEKEGDSHKALIDGKEVLVNEKNGKFGIFYNQNHDTVEAALKAFIDTQSQ
ncbi:MAG: hypothetical protein Aureis2KO_24210 [Aureisphaera sp.]